MVELRSTGSGHLFQSFAGDSLNTAVYLARLVRPAGRRVDYLTAVGDDSLSQRMLGYFETEGIGTAAVQRRPRALPGLYLIETDEKGEREFHYWRRESAARRMLQGPAGEALLERLADYDLIYLSGISLAILPAAHRGRLLSRLRELRSAGKWIVFDSNHRRKLWRTVGAARSCYREALAVSRLATVTYEDERLVAGDRDPEATVSRLLELGVEEIVVKLGAKGALVGSGGTVQHVPTEAREACDTTAAGDAFNAAYFASRLAGQTPALAAAAGNRLAGLVVTRAGAIVPAAEMPAVSLAPTA